MADEKQVEELTSEIGGYLEDAISKLDEVVIPENEIENVVESVVSERNEQIGLFIDNYRQFEYNLQSLYRQIHSNADKIGTAFIPIRKALSELSATQIVPKELVESINQITNIRNIIVHGTNIEFPSAELIKYSAELEYVQNFLLKNKDRLLSLVCPKLKSNDWKVPAHDRSSMGSYRKILTCAKKTGDKSTRRNGCNPVYSLYRHSMA
ncbi:hypothetical protein Halhy_0892 [Haliscomenobacter hydrossis DSM 1100]|uniref:Uncharacterized protein n=1 Tax=Haliscomenobacter hydrossis (strain ATCC 27775 / DSM 1100 / LMG 10767 / O) TaxID=760192 RepID=F4L6B4_HALH1|nr:hypothetical protein Halhy_0892 [Haliscomenobacter hydrossis DSM 1100]